MTETRAIIKDIAPSRLGYNPTEAYFQKLAMSAGWKATKRGWPDFLCFGPKGEVIAVEVKPRRKSGRLGVLKKEQAVCMDILSSHGIKCFVSDGKALELYSRDEHANERFRRTRLGIIS